MAYFYIPIIIFSWAILIFRNQLKLELTLPNVSQFWWLIFIGVTLFVADFCLFTAYKNGGSVVGITILTGTLFPIFASLINVSTGGGWPKWNEVVGYCFAAVAVVFVSLGGKH
jgi:drug/metabolite transporter (DMT)-like permease